MEKKFGIPLVLISLVVITFGYITFSHFFVIHQIETPHLVILLGVIPMI